MNLYFLGTGSESNYQFPRRKNASLLLEMENENAIIDVGDAFPDNWNLLKQKYPDLKFPSILIFSHAHIDHICSFAAFRYYAQKENTTFRTYATRETLGEILKTFHWLNVDDFNIIEYLEYGKKIQISEEQFIPIRFSHGKIDSTGIKFGKNVIVPDFDGIISKENVELMMDASNITIECNDLDPGLFSHNNLANSIEIGRRFNKDFKLEKLFLTHLGDEFPVEKTECQKMIVSKYPNEKFEIIVPDDLEKFIL